MGKVETVRRRHGFKSLGSFIFGMVFGILLLAGILFGVGYWAYKNANLKTVEKMTKSEIDINEKYKDFTLEYIIKTALNIGKNMDTYTIQDFENDFNTNIIDDTYYGIDLMPLKKSTIKTIKDDLTNVIKGITLNSVMSAMEIDENSSSILSSIINSKNTYYFDIETEKLYTDVSMIQEVGFDYSIKKDESSNYTIKINTYEFTTSTSGDIDVAVRYLPASTSLADLNGIVGDLKVYQVLDLTDDDNDGKYQTKSGENCSNLINCIADMTIDSLSTEIDNIKLNKFLGDDASICKLLVLTDWDGDGDNTNNYPALKNIDDAISKAMSKSTLGNLVDCGFITLDSEYQEGGIYYTAYQSVKNMTIKEILEDYIKSI